MPTRNRRHAPPAPAALLNAVRGRLADHLDFEIRAGREKLVSVARSYADGGMDLDDFLPQAVPLAAQLAADSEALEALRARAAGGLSYPDARVSPILDALARALVEPAITSSLAAFGRD